MVITIGNCAKTSTREKSGLGRLSPWAKRENKSKRENIWPDSFIGVLKC